MVFQDDTLVLQGHRGNKLGLLIKLANMERLTEQFPDARVIYTWNAPENRYLLTVNQQLGFIRLGGFGMKVVIGLRRRFCLLHGRKRKDERRCFLH